MNTDAQAPPPRPRRKSLFGTKASKAAAAQASASTNATSSPLPPPPTPQVNAEAGPSRTSPTKKSGHRRSGSHLVRVASTGAGKVLGIGRDRDHNTSSASAASSDQAATATSSASSVSSSSPNQSPTRNRSASVGINVSSPLSPPQLDRSPSSASNLDTAGRPRSSTWRRLRPGSALGNHLSSPTPTSDVETLNDSDQATTVKGRKTPRASMLAAFKDPEGAGDSSIGPDGQRRGSLSPQPQQRKGLFSRSPSFQPSRNSDAGSSNRDGGLLRRIGSRSRLGDGSRESFNASQDSLASTASSTAASLSRRVGNVAERAMPDWLQGRARPAEGDAGGGSEATTPSAPRKSSDATASRATPNGLATPGGRSRSGSASAVRHLSPTAEDPASPEGGLPKRLSGWLLNMLGTETSPPPTATGNSPTLAHAPLDAKVRRQSNTSVASAGSGSSKAKSAHSNASGGGGGGAPVVAKVNHHNAGFLSHARARATAAAGAAASTSGLDRALRYIHEGSQEEEEIWLLGVRHGRAEVAAEVETTQRLGPAIEIHEASAPTSPVKERGGNNEPPSPRLDAASRSLQRQSFASEEAPVAQSKERSASSNDDPPPPERPRSHGSSPTATSSKGAALHRVATSNDFQADFSSRIWCTYRNHFGPIARDGSIAKEAEEAAANIAASTAAASAAARAHEAASSLSAKPGGDSTPGGSSPAPSDTAPSSAATSTPRATGWLGRRLIDATPGTDTLAHASPSLGAALGVSPGTSPPASSITSGNSNGSGSASLSLSEKMGIPNLWGRATAAVQATGLTGRSGLTTDSGWGCMLRTGQSLLANALIEVHLGREWRRTTMPPSPPSHDNEGSASSSALTEQRRRHARYVELLSWFMDDASSACPFSVHRMAREGKRLGKEVGEWFGPSTAAGAIRKLVDEFPQARVGVSVATDGVVYLSEVRRAAKVPRSAAASSPTMAGKLEGKNPTTRPVLILIGVRLGLEGVHPTYYDSIRQLFTFPQSVGIAGGRPGSSYYFVGFQGDNLLYLDPHNVRAAVPFRHPPPKTASGGEAKEQDNEEEQRNRLTNWWCQAYSDAELSTYHCDRPRRMPVRSLDPSMLLGFLVDVEEPSDDGAETSLDDWAARVKALPKPIFSVQEQMPRWMRDTGSSSVEEEGDEFDLVGEGDAPRRSASGGGGGTGMAASPVIDDDPSLESFSESSQTDEPAEGEGEGETEGGERTVGGATKADERAVLEPSRQGNGKVEASATTPSGSSKSSSSRSRRLPEESPSSTRWPSEEETSRPNVSRATTVTPGAPLHPSADAETERPRLSSMASDATARNAKSRPAAKAKDPASPSIPSSSATTSSSSARPSAVPASSEESIAGNTSADSSLTTASNTSQSSVKSSSSVPFPHAKGGSRRDSTGEAGAGHVKRHHHEGKRSPTSPKLPAHHELQRRQPQQAVEAKGVPQSPEAPSRSSGHASHHSSPTSNRQAFPQQQQQRNGERPSEEGSGIFDDAEEDGVLLPHSPSMASTATTQTQEQDESFFNVVAPSSSSTSSPSQGRFIHAASPSLPTPAAAAATPRSQESAAFSTSWEDVSPAAAAAARAASGSHCNATPEVVGQPQRFIGRDETTSTATAAAMPSSPPTSRRQPQQHKHEEDVSEGWSPTFGPVE